ncbi:MAG: fructosamine kinase family protein [Arhodomonas sp.]|nr:fructosamine kinase family protein [Arhodomonas sp.]
MLEWLALAGPGADGWARMGRAVAALHRCTAERFGWHRDNTIGTTTQPNGWHDDWVRFFAEQRLGHQLRLAADNGGSRDLLDDGERLREHLGGLFSGYRPMPSLLHGDLLGAATRPSTVMATRCSTTRRYTSVIGSRIWP